MQFERGCENLAFLEFRQKSSACIVTVILRFRHASHLLSGYNANLGHPDLMNATVPKDCDLSKIEIGLGAWQWGDRLVWGYGHGYGDGDVRAAFEAAVDMGAALIDTAEIYGNGRSERLLGNFMRQGGKRVCVATKYFPWPWRLARSAVESSLRRSLDRLGLETVDLYQLHWPSPVGRNRPLLEAMARAVHDGLARAVGISNFGTLETEDAHATLLGLGIPLASNQVHYSLLNRKVERNGLLDKCNALGIRLIAHTPLEKGLLSGKYSPHNPPHGLRFGQYATILPRIAPLLRAMMDVGHAHGEKSCAQVALNWVICKGALPIPGGKSAAQAIENAGAVGWRLSAEAVEHLDAVSDQIVT